MSNAHNSSTHRHSLVKRVNSHSRADIGELTRDTKERVIVALQISQNLAVEDADARKCRGHYSRYYGPQIRHIGASMRSP